MEFDSVIAKRVSCRKFKNKKVSWKDVLEAIDAANQGPFAGNHNHLKFIIVEDENKIAELAKLAEQHWIADAKILVVVSSDDTHLERLYGERGRVYSRQQAGAAIEQFLLKLVDLGLSACWVGAYADDMVRDKLGILGHIQVEAMIPIGYASEKIGRKTKKSLEDAIFWEKWDNRKRPAPIHDAIQGPDPSSFVGRS